MDLAGETGTTSRQAHFEDYQKMSTSLQNLTSDQPDHHHRRRFGSPAATADVHGCGGVVLPLPPWFGDTLDVVVAQGLPGCFRAASTTRFMLVGFECVHVSGWKCQRRVLSDGDLL
uniref:Uncharacterized protein n=1 Tax=Anopheles culicifacies TaxID=139723 RepID=A0A182M3C7_9DIPT